LYHILYSYSQNQLNWYNLPEKQLIAAVLIHVKGVPCTSTPKKPARHMVGCTKTVQPPDDMLSVLPLTADEVPPVVHSDQVTEQSAELPLVTEEVQPAVVSTELLGEPPDDVLSVLPLTTEEVQPVVVPSDQVTEQSAGTTTDQ